MAVSREALVGQWIHSHEEDEPGRTVFRRPDFIFPPARGRDSFVLRSDGTASLGRPGPDDAPEERPGTWQFKGKTLRLGGRSLEVVSLEGERLVLGE